MRGLVQRWLAVGRQLPTSHFALLENRLDFTILDTPFPFVLFLPQPKTEALLREHVAELGVPVLGGHAVRGTRQQDGLVPEWEGVGAVLLRPDGHIGWVGPDASTESAVSLLRALTGWLDAMPMAPVAQQGHSSATR